MSDLFFGNYSTKLDALSRLDRILATPRIERPLSRKELKELSGSNPYRYHQYLEIQGRSPGVFHEIIVDVQISEIWVYSICQVRNFKR